MPDKETIRSFAYGLGAGLVGFGPVERYAAHGDLPAAFHPQNIWPQAKTVIALSVPSLLPTTETKVAHLYRSQYHNTNSLLDEIAYRTAAYLNRQGCAAINISRDGYGTGTLQIKPAASFSHVWAAYYAGLGVPGWNHALLTPQYGPRHRLVTVLTALELEGDPMVENELCTRCGACARACPAQSFSGDPRAAQSDMDRFACMGRDRVGIYAHCGFCIKVCPIGEDRVLYDRQNTAHYAKEAACVDAWSLGLAPGARRWV